MVVVVVEKQGFVMIIGENFAGRSTGMWKLEV